MTGRVAIVSHNSARLLTSFFGVSGYGRVLVPINFRLSAEEFQYLIAHSGATVVCVDAEYLEAVDRSVTRQQALADLRATGLVLAGHGRGAKWSRPEEGPRRREPAGSTASARAR